MNTVIVRVKLFPAREKQKKNVTEQKKKKILEQVLRKSNPSFVVELEHPVRHSKVSWGVESWCWIHSLHGNCSKLSGKQN